MTQGEKTTNRTMSIIYDLTFAIFALLYIPLFLLKKRKREAISLRLGLYPKHIITKLKEHRNIWIHAVSVGEVMAMSSLFQKLKGLYPDYRLIVTTVTETGNLLAKRLLKEEDIVLFLPFDISFVVRNVVAKLKPSMLIITETELWPNLITQAHAAEVPIFLVNGRISEKSFRRYRLIKFILRPILAKIDFFLMQTKNDKARILSLGASPSKVSVVGNMKFDSAVSLVLKDEDKQKMRELLNLKKDDRLIVAGSTHSGEEDIILSAFSKLKTNFADIKLLIAPRHIERVAEIEKLISGYRHLPIRVSSLYALRPAQQASGVFILDTIGQLKNFYSIAEIVFIGGSLVKKGGQNMIEPAVFAKPIIVGSYTYNFRDVVGLFLEKGAMLVVKDEKSLQNAMELLLRDSEFCKSMGEAAKKVVEENRGATDITSKICAKAIKEMVST